MSHPLERRTFPVAARIVPLLCFGVILLDGYDLVVMGVVIPSLRDDAAWRLSAEGATVISSFGLVGMTLGALMVGPLADRFGRRGTFIWSVLSFSVLTGLGAAAPTPEAFGVLKFLAGLGLGACLPTAILLVTEFAYASRRSTATGVVFIGYVCGSILAPLLGIFVLNSLGWRALFVIGSLPGILLVPLIWRYLPESPALLKKRGRLDEAKKIADQYGLDIDQLPQVQDDASKAPVRDLLSRRYLRNSIAIWIASFMGLLLVYGLNTWLPTIMAKAGYDLGQSLAFLIVFNAGAVLGLVVGGRVADRIGPRTAAIVWFAVSALLLAAMSVNIGLGIYAVVFAAGVFAPTSQVLLYALVATSHPIDVRATALGASAGVGRLGAISGPILGGILVSLGLAIPWGFYGFALVAGIGAIATLCVSFAAARRSEDRALAGQIADH